MKGRRGQPPAPADPSRKSGRDLHRDSDAVADLGRHADRRQSLATGTRKVLIEGGADARYVPTGHLVYVRRSTLMAVPFDPRDLTVSGGPVALSSDVMQAANMTHTARDSGAGQFSIAASGSLAYVPGGIYFPGSLARVDGSIGPYRGARGAAGRLHLPTTVAPRNRVLVSIQGDRKIWIYDVVAGRPQGSRRKAEARRPSGLLTARASRSAHRLPERKPVLGAGGWHRDSRAPHQEPLFHRASAWSPDGRFSPSSRLRQNQYDILTFPSAGQRSPYLLCGHDSMRATPNSRRTAAGWRMPPTRPVDQRFTCSPIRGRVPGR